MRLSLNQSASFGILPDEMRVRSALAVTLLVAASVIAACQPAPGGGSEPAEPSQAAPSQAAESDAAAPAAPSETPRDNPNY
jgi:hypothetical protein